MYLALQLAVREQSHSIEQQHHSACAVAMKKDHASGGHIEPLLHSNFCDDWIVQCHFMFAR